MLPKNPHDPQRTVDHTPDDVIELPLDAVTADAVPGQNETMDYDGKAPGRPEQRLPAVLGKLKTCRPIVLDTPSCSSFVPFGPQ